MSFRQTKGINNKNSIQEKKLVYSGEHCPPYTIIVNRVLNQSETGGGLPAVEVNIEPTNPIPEEPVEIQNNLDIPSIVEENSKDEINNNVFDLITEEEDVTLGVEEKIITTPETSVVVVIEKPAAIIKKEKNKPAAPETKKKVPTKQTNSNKKQTEKKT
jgi:hypothetical protein